MKTEVASPEWSLDAQSLDFGVLKAILTAEPDTLDPVLDQVLARVGAALGLCGVFAGLPGTARHWSAARGRDRGSALAGLSLADLPSWRAALARGEAVSVPDTARLSDDLPEKRRLQARGIAALLVVPVRQGDALTGLFGLAMTTPRVFSPGEIEIAETLAAAMASATRGAGASERVERVNACLKATLDAIPDLVLELDPDGRFVKHHVGRSMIYLPIAEGLDGRLPEEVFPAKGAAIARAVIADVDRTGSSEGRTFFYDMPGGRRWYQISAAAHDQGGYVLVVQDITNQRNYLRELEWLGDVARRTSNLVVVTDAEGRIEWVNPAFEAISGWSLDEVRGHAPGSFLHCEQTDPDTIRRLARAREAHEPVDTEILIRSRAGKHLWLKSQIQPRFDRKGQHFGFIAVETDVTELIEARSTASAAEQRAKASREQLVSAVEALKDGFVLYDAEDRLVLANSRHRSMFPQTAPLMVEGAAFEDILRRAVAVGEINLPPELVTPVLSLRQAGQVFDNQIQRLEDGRVLMFHDNPTADGGRVGLGSDITELTLSQLKLRAIVEGASVGTWEWNVPTGAFDVNDRWAEMIGYRTDEILNENGAFFARCHDDDKPRIQAEIKTVASGLRDQFDLRFRARHKQGHWVWILSRGRVLQRDPAGKPLLMSGIHMDITEMVEARERAESANAAKSAFLATMSHEIRTPLNGVLGMADLLAGTPLTFDQRRMLDTVRESGWSLLAVLDDILDLSRLEAGKLELELRPFDLGLLLGRLETLHSAAARAKGLTFEVVLDGAPLERVGDPTRITQILQNLVGNAIKFTDAGRVRFTVRADSPDHVDFSVTDTGIGMTEGQISRIFEEFQQADSGIARRFGGSGLGLAIVQRLVEQMGGTVSVTSTPGRGTAVSLRLPLGVVAEGCATDPGTGVRSAGDAAPGVDLVGLRVLVAEDNATNRKIMQIMLGKLGVNARFAHDGAQALTAWREQPFDLIILDISMPVVDGIEALQTMQREARDAGAPPPRAIAATANVMKEQVEEYGRVGFLETIPKPIRFEQLTGVLKRLQGVAAG